MLEAVRFFSDPDAAIQHVAAMRWPDGPACPKRGVLDKKHYYLKSRRIWKCRACRKQFSVKVGTIFEGSPIGLDKWLPAMWIIANAKNEVSSYEIACSVSVAQKTAWFMMHRIRLVMQSGSTEKLSGHVEADETYIGGKARNMHKHEQKITGRGSSSGVAVMGLLERHGKVPAMVVSDLGETLVQNRLAAALLGDQARFTGPARSAVYRWFTDPDERRLYPESDHDHQSRVQVSNLRASLGRGGGDARGSTIVERLRDESPEFVDLWDRHEVAVRFDDHKTIVHPDLGDIELDCQILFTQNQAQALLIFTAPPDTEGHEKLQLLSVIGTQQLAPDPDRRDRDFRSR